jgi:hypothetical protein
MLSSPRRSMPWIRFSLARPPHDDVLSQETSETSDLAGVWLHEPCPLSKKDLTRFTSVGRHNCR